MLLGAVVMSVCPSVRNNLASTGRILMKFGIYVFILNMSRKHAFHQNLVRITGVLHEDQHTIFLHISLNSLRMRNVSDKSCREIQNTYFVFGNFFLLPPPKVMPFMR
jgi:hypothetical protein